MIKIFGSVLVSGCKRAALPKAVVMISMFATMQRKQRIKVILTGLKMNACQRSTKMILMSY